MTTAQVVGGSAGSSKPRTVAAISSEDVLVELDGLRRSLNAVKDRMDGLATKKQVEGLATKEQLEALAADTRKQVEGLATNTKKQIEALAGRLDGMDKKLDMLLEGG